MRLIILSISLFVFTLFYSGVNDFFFAVYSLTKMSAMLPFWAVAGVLWVVVILMGFGVLVALSNTRKGTQWVIICLPMSALPFILLGVPLGALNAIFICRSLVNIFVVFLFMKWFLDVTLRRSPSIRLPLFPLIGLFGMVYITNVLLAEKDIRGEIIQSVFIYASCVLMFYLVVNIFRDAQSLKKLMEIIVIACMVQVMMSSLSFFYYLIIKHRAIFRVEGMLRDYELFAEYLAMHIPVYIFLLRNPGELLSRKVLKVFLVLTIFVLFATATRGAVISLGIGLLYYLTRMRTKIRLTEILLQVFLWGGITACVLVVLYKFLPSSAQIIERFSGTDLSTLDTRQFVWLKFWSFFTEKPFSGHGMVYDMGSHLFFPHSTYFYYLLTMGIPGCAVYVLILLTLGFKGLKNERQTRSMGWVHEMAVIFNTLLIIFAVDGIKIEYLRYPNYQLFAWTVFALTASLSQWAHGKTREVLDLEIQSITSKGDHARIAHQ